MNGMFFFVDVRISSARVAENFGIAQSERTTSHGSRSSAIVMSIGVSTRTLWISRFIARSSRSTSFASVIESSTWRIRSGLFTPRSEQVVAR